MVIQMRFKLDEVALEVCHGEGGWFKRWRHYGDGGFGDDEFSQDEGLEFIELTNEPKSGSMDSIRVYHTTLDSFKRPKLRYKLYNRNELKFITVYIEAPHQRDQVSHSHVCKVEIKWVTLICESLWLNGTL